MANFNKEMLILGRESRKVSQQSLAELTKISQPKLSRFESGLAQPSDEEIAKLADALIYPPHFFTQESVSLAGGTEAFHHRKRQRLPLLTQRQIHASLRLRRMEIHDLMHDVDIGAVRGFGTIMDPDDYSGDIEAIARQVRALWGIPHGPVPNMSALIESRGGLIVPCRFDTPHLDAVSVLPAGTPALFFVDTSQPTDRWRLTLAHEVGHLVMHDGPRDDAEGEANRFAGAFLLPAEEIRDELAAPLTLAKLAALKQRWKVSMQALIHRAQDLGTISKGEAQWLYVQIQRMGWKRNEPGLLPPEPPRLLRSILDLHREEHAYTIDDLSEKVGLNSREFLATYFPGEGHLRLIS